MLDLQHNPLIGLSNYMQDQLDHHPGLQLDLSNNPISCMCDNIDFVEWIQGKTDTIQFTNVENYICSEASSSKSVYLMEVDLSSLKWNCDKSRVVIAAICGTFAGLLLITVPFLIYRKRWFLRRKMLDIKDAVKPRGIDQEMPEYDYDAFVLYNSNVVSFMCH